MAKVIAVQDGQLKLLKENYNKNVPIISAPSNNLGVSETSSLGNSINSTMPQAQIDMESQVVNLNSKVNSSEPVITNADVTKEVFGVSDTNPVITQNLSENKTFPVSAEPSPTVFDDIYKNTVEQKEIPVKVLSDEAYVELFNNLRNIIAEASNKAYSAVDKIQEQFLQGKKTGADLVDNNENDVPFTQNSNITNDSLAISGSESILPVNNSNADPLENTVILSPNFIMNSITEPETGITKSAA